MWTATLNCTRKVPSCSEQLQLLQYTPVTWNILYHPIKSCCKPATKAMVKPSVVVHGHLVSEGYTFGVTALAPCMSVLKRTRILIVPYSITLNLSCILVCSQWKLDYSMELELQSSNETACLKWFRKSSIKLHGICISNNRHYAILSTWVLRRTSDVGSAVVSYQTTPQHWYRNNKNATGKGGDCKCFGPRNLCQRPAWRYIFINCNIWYHLWFESMISPRCLLVPSIVQLEFCTGHRRVLIQDAREAVTMIPAKLAVHWHVLCIQWRIYCLDNYTCHSTWNCCPGYMGR